VATTSSASSAPPSRSARAPPTSSATTPSTARWPPSRGRRPGRAPATDGPRPWRQSSALALVLLGLGLLRGGAAGRPHEEEEELRPRLAVVHDVVPEPDGRGVRVAGRVVLDAG